MPKMLAEQQLLIGRHLSKLDGRQSRGALEIAKHACQSEGLGVFFQGLGTYGLRAFVVSARS